MTTTQNQIAKQLRGCASGVYREFVAIAGARGGVLLSLLVTNSADENEGWIAKSEADIFKATGMTGRELGAATSRLRSLKLIETEGGKYRVDFDQLGDAIERLGR